MGGETEEREGVGFEEIFVLKWEGWILHLVSCKDVQVGNVFNITYFLENHKGVLIESVENHGT